MGTTTRVLIADSLAPEGPKWLQSQRGVHVSIQKGLSGDALAAALADHDGVVVRSAIKITAADLDAAMALPGANLKAIARAGVGVDNIDLDAATKYGIAVMNSAAASTITTAEHAFALMAALARNIAPAAATLSAGGWDRNKFTGAQLHGRTLGVVGMGRIGQTMAQRAIAFGMNVIGFDPYVTADSMLDGKVRMLRSFDDLISQVDVVSFHVPMTEQTEGMLGREQFAKARPGLLVINAARGGIVDEAALIEALDSGHCAGAAIDVFTTEPPPADHALRKHPKVLCTPHLGASTEEAQEAVSIDACKALLMYLRGEALIGCVNAGGLSLDLDDRQKAFADLSGRMIRLLDASAQTPAFSAIRFRVRGKSIAGKADTIACHALTQLLQSRLDQPVTVINAPHIAEERGIATSTTIASHEGEDRLRIELSGGGDQGGAWRVDGAIYEDGLPRITNLNGYALDMVPAGQMVLLTNDDVPGMIGKVGAAFGAAKVNIAEMVIGRRSASEGGTEKGGQVAMMILKLDASPGEKLLQTLRQTDGVRAVAQVRLPAVN